MESLDNFDIGEIFEQEAAAEVLHTESLSQAVWRSTQKLGCSHGCRERYLPRGCRNHDGQCDRRHHWLRKILDHVSLTTRFLTQPRVCRLWPQAAAGRWVFDFQHRRPCFAALDHIWKEIVQFHGWRPISTTCADELLSCICMVPLIYTDMRAPLSSRVFCTDASEFGAGGCETIGLTTAGVAAGCEEAAQARNSSSEETSVRIAAKALVLGLLRRADHRSTDVRIDCPFDRTHGLGPPSDREDGIGESFCNFRGKGQVHTSMNWNFGPCSHCCEVWPGPVATLECVSPCLWTV